MNAIVAVDENWGIGKNGDLLFHIPEDMKYFKEKTLHKVVVMGRNTFESLPKREPLPYRTNVILTSDVDYHVDDAVIVHSEQELLGYLKQYDSEDIFIIGGGTVYSMMLPYCDTVLVTKVNAACAADVYFPDLDEHPDFKPVWLSETRDYDGITFNFTRWIRCKD